LLQRRCQLSGTTSPDLRNGAVGVAQWNRVARRFEIAVEVIEAEDLHLDGSLNRGCDRGPLGRRAGSQASARREQQKA
jgi:hypothetical protein